jgi:RNA polymerase sigma-70 factor (ECF subfamily)
MPNIDDYIERLKSKDNDAFKFIYEQTKRGVYAVIVAIVKDRSTTEDLMQDTYVKMLKNLDKYERGRNFNAWITQIAKNLALDYYRRNHKTSIIDPLENSQFFDREQEAKSISEYSLEEMLIPLDDIERQVVLLHIVSETKFKTIAEIVDKPLGTVLWIYQKALQKIKKHLGKESS